MLKPLSLLTNGLVWVEGGKGLRVSTGRGRDNAKYFMQKELKDEKESAIITLEKTNRRKYNDNKVE